MRVREVIQKKGKEKGKFKIGGQKNPSLWNYTTGGPVQSSPAVANGVGLRGECR